MAATDPVKITGKPRFQRRGKSRVQVVFLPLAQYPVGRGWFVHSGSLVTNTWYKPVVLKPTRRP